MLSYLLGLASGIIVSVVYKNVIEKPSEKVKKIIADIKSWLD